MLIRFGRWPTCDTEKLLKNISRSDGEYTCGVFSAVKVAFSGSGAGTRISQLTNADAVLVGRDRVVVEVVQRAQAIGGYLHVALVQTAVNGL